MQKRTIKSRIGSFFIPNIPISREAFDIIRFEGNAFFVRLSCALNPFKRASINKVISQNDLSVNVGAGPFGEIGWVNVDLFKANNITFIYDCRKKLPFKTGSVARIRCEHVMEHLDRISEVPKFLSECYRCLQPGGTLRIVVPDAEKFIRAYVENTKEAWMELNIDKDHYNDDWQPMDNLNKIFRQGGEHKFAYDFETVRVAFANAGFKKINRADYGVSNDDLLKNDQENHRFHSLYVEGIKD